MSISDGNKDNSQFREWFLSTKRKLLQSEAASIEARAQHFEMIIQSLVSNFMHDDSLGLDQRARQSVPPFRCVVKPSEHLQFLIDWPGLRTCGSKPTERDYERKSKNWLKGRRAPNFAKTLFPHFIRLAEQYSERVSQLLVVDDKARQATLYKALMFHVLARLCGCNMQCLPFFCKNSLERKGKLRAMLQVLTHQSLRRNSPIM